MELHDVTQMWRHTNEWKDKQTSFISTDGRKNEAVVKKMGGAKTKPVVERMKEAAALSNDKRTSKNRKIGVAWYKEKEGKNAT